MGAPASLLPELEDVVQHGSPEKRAETLRRITTLFLDGADRFAPEHVALFDDVMGMLDRGDRDQGAGGVVPRAGAGAECAGRGREFARQERRYRGGGSRAAPGAARRIRFARRRRRPKARRICSRCRPASASPKRCPICWWRAATATCRASIATNTQARLSEQAFTTLVERAQKDGVLAEKVGLRADIPPRLFRQLLMQATEVVQQRLMAQAKPETQAEIRRVLAKVSREVGAKAAPRNYTAALATVRALNAERKLSEADITEFAKAAQIRRDHRGAGDDLRRAGRCGRPPDGRRTFRSGAHSGALRRISAGIRCGPLSTRGPARREPRRRRSMPRRKISNGSRRRPRSASCASGRFVRAPVSRLSGGGSAGNSAPGLRASLLPRSASPQNQATARASRRRSLPATRNPANAERASASRRRNRRYRWRNEIRRPVAAHAPAAARLSSCTKRRFHCRRFGHGSG